MILALLLFAYLSEPQVISASPFTLIQSSNWEDRYDGAKMLIREHPLSDPAIQRTLVKLLERESADPNWAELDELEPHEEYYDYLLSDTVKKIATTYHNTAAFYALTHSNYNADSEFGRWLATEPEAFPVLLAQAKDDPNPGLRGLADQVLAFAVSFCPPGNQKETCSFINQRRDALLATFRGLARDWGNEQHWVTGIVCLSICGTPDDLALLKSFQSGSDLNVRRFVPLFIQNLEEHLGLPPTPLPWYPASPPPASGIVHR